MAIRNLLHKNKLEKFKNWLDENDIPHRDGKGEYEVIQIMTKDGWQKIYKRLNMPEHLTIQDKIYPLIKRFLKEQKVKNEISNL